jgi:Dolichyl-phosphate-mannose-protein mannosyltransferase
LSSARLDSGGLTRLAPALAVVGILTVFGLLFFQQAAQLYVIDEAEFPLVAKAIAEEGRPIYYRGEDLPENVGIWHPPLYIYSLGVWQQIVGSSHAAVRAYGLVCALLSSILGWLLLRRLAPHRYPWLGVAWLALFLLHPYAIQSALLPDIDTTVLVPSSMLGLWLMTETVVARRWSPPLTSTLFGLALGANLLGKLTTPLALVPLFVVALALSTRSLRSTVGGTAIMLGVAAVLFTSVWGAIALFARVDFTYPFTFTYDSFVTRSGSQSLGDRLELLRPSDSVQFWLTPLLLILFAIGTLVALRHIRDRAGQAVLLVAAFGGSVFFTYNVVTGAPFGFPKYYAPALGAITIVAVAPLAFGPGGELALRRKLTPVALTVFSVLVVLALGASFIEYASQASTEVHPVRHWWFLGSLAVIVMAALATILLPHERRLALRAWGLIAVSSLLVVLAVTDLSTAMAQRSSDHAVRYFPGERDFGLTVAKVKQVLGGRAGVERAHLISAKDIGYESGVRYYEDGLYLASPDQLADLIRNDPRMIIVTRDDYDFSRIVWPEAFATIAESAKPIWVSPSGDFTVWKSRSSAAKSRQG